jgi:hypothetical protein
MCRCDNKERTLAPEVYPWMSLVMARQQRDSSSTSATITVLSPYYYEIWPARFNGVTPDPNQELRFNNIRALDRSTMKV